VAGVTVAIVIGSVATARDPDAEGESVQGAENADRAVSVGVAKNLSTRVIRADPSVPALLVTVVEVVTKSAVPIRNAHALQVRVDVHQHATAIVATHVIALIQVVTVTIQHALVINHQSLVEPSGYPITEMELQADL